MYLISVDGVPMYIGSSLKRAYEKRKKDHIRNDLWLVGKIAQFEIIDECEDEVRYINESHLWKSLIDNGYELMNKRDPINSWPVTIREFSEMIVITRRKNRSYKNQFENMTDEQHHSRSVKAAKTRKANGSKYSNGRSPNGGKANLGRKKSETHKSNIAMSRKIMAFARQNKLSYEEAKEIWLTNPGSPPDLLNRGTVEELQS